MVRIDLIFWFGTLIIALSACQKSTNTPPNIIILLADDLGYGDLNCYGGIASTPNLDKLASQGIQFSDFYSAAPNCSPARAGLMTGKDPAKVGMFNYMPGGHPMHLKGEEMTIAEIAQQGGYATSHFGKWHLSNLTADYDLGQPQPSDHGFDYSLGTTNNAQPSHLNPENFIRNGKKVGIMKGYSCQIIVEEGLEWVRSIPDRSSPFFMFLAFHEPHKKVASPPNLVAKYSDYDIQNAEYLANVENLDKSIGHLLNQLEILHLEKNTIILFASDNGSYRKGSNGPLLGGKSFVYEGGIRVPGIIRWPAQIEPNQKIAVPVNLIDIMPTMCKLINVKHPIPNTLDGVDISPLFETKPIDRMQPMSWFFYRTTPEIAMRLENHVILGRSNDSIRLTHPTAQSDMEHIRQMTLNEYELYDVKRDMGQNKNLFDLSSDAGSYSKILNKRLEDIQGQANYWNNLPPGTTRKLPKNAWRQLRPTGFSN